MEVCNVGDGADVAQDSFSLLNLKITGILNLVGLSLLLISLGRLHAKDVFFGSFSEKIFTRCGNRLELDVMRVVLH